MERMIKRRFRAVERMGINTVLFLWIMALYKDGTYSMRDEGSLYQHS